MLGRFLACGILMAAHSVAWAQTEAMIPGIFLSDETRVVMPMLDIAATLNTAGFTLVQSGTDERRMSVRLFAVNRVTGIVLSLFLEFTAEEGDANAAREHYWEKLQRAPMTSCSSGLFAR